ncbi:MAG: NAD-dependent epimerase/dehydratase family protein [Parcubacteria group bacterium]|nr:NAD-dependent epimerase/dehydratase family protein [Parcubacteria group bacterium]
MENSSKEKILVTGGAGYVGSLVVPLLLERGYAVTVLDNLMYRQSSLLQCFSVPHFTFVKGDIRDNEVLKKIVPGHDYIIHLAAIVGEPACKKDPETATAINYQGTLNLLNASSPDQRFIFSSTGSVYGKIDGICTEESFTNPVSVYAKNKLDAEKAVADRGNFVTYRFATAFGLSPRPRLDLLINDFVWRALREKSLIVYEANFKRTFIHVRDMARAFAHAVKHFESMKNELYNVGSEDLNFTKAEVAKKVREKIDFWLHFADFGTDPDQRNYEVSYAKVKSKGYNTILTLDHGIDELLKGYEMLNITNPFSNIEH